MWAYKHFNMYIFGRHFELETDHEPLEYIYSQKSKPFACVEHWVLCLQAYDLKVIYKLGRTNIADVLSRLNCRVPCGEGQYYDHVRSEVENSTLCALTPSEIEKALTADPEMNLVKECVHMGDWNACNIPAYLHVKNELCSYGQLQLHGSRIVIPQVLQEHVLKLAHEGHEGIVKTKCRLYSRCGDRK